jgi:hypothetical protein
MSWTDETGVVHHQIDIAQRSSTVVAAAPSDPRSRRSAGNTSTPPPAARTASAVVVRLPGKGVVSDFFTVLECSRCSPSSIVRAVIATSKAALRQPDRDRLADPAARSRYKCLPPLRHFPLPLH